MSKGADELWAEAEAVDAKWLAARAEVDAAIAADDKPRIAHAFQAFVDAQAEWQANSDEINLLLACTEIERDDQV